MHILPAVLSKNECNESSVAGNEPDGKEACHAGMTSLRVLSWMQVHTPVYGHDCCLMQRSLPATTCASFRF